MIGNDYFARQAMTLRRMAQATKDPAVSTELLNKVADLETKADGTDEAPSDEDRSHVGDG